MQRYEFSSIKEGDSAEFEIEISEADVDLFASLSGDINPLHMDGDFSKQRGFLGRVVHGFYLAALVSRLVGVYLPGQNALIQQTQLTFHSPTYIGDKIKVTGIVDRKSEGVNTLKVSINILRTSDNVLLVSGKVQIGFTKVTT